MQEAFERRPSVRCDGANPVAQIFEGKIVTSIRCTDVDFTSEKVDTFQDIQLPVSGEDTATLADSLKLYCQEQTLDGDDKSSFLFPFLMLLPNR